MNNKYQKISLTFEVPKGNYCWNHKNYATCYYFDNQFGNVCELFDLYLQKGDDNGVPKLEQCLNASVIE